MHETERSLTPPQLLALRYAHGGSRRFLELVLQLDARLLQMVSTGKEPLLTQMKLAWWRDALAKTADSRPKGEPLLSAISELELSGDRNIQRSASRLVDAWEELVEDPFTQDQTILERHRSGRIDAIFHAFGEGLVERNNLTIVGEIWCANRTIRDMPKLPRSCRSLSILAMASAKEGEASPISVGHFFWHALTGR